MSIKLHEFKSAGVKRKRRRRSEPGGPLYFPSHLARPVAFLQRHVPGRRDLAADEGPVGALKVPEIAFHGMVMEESVDKGQG